MHCHVGVSRHLWMFSEAIWKAFFLHTCNIGTGSGWGGGPPRHHFAHKAGGRNVSGQFALKLHVFLAAVSAPELEAQFSSSPSFPKRGFCFLDVSVALRCPFIAAECFFSFRNCIGGWDASATEPHPCVAGRLWPRCHRLAKRASPEWHVQCTADCWHLWKWPFRRGSADNGAGQDPAGWAYCWPLCPALLFQSWSICNTSNHKCMLSILLHFGMM